MEINSTGRDRPAQDAATPRAGPKSDRRYVLRPLSSVTWYLGAIVMVALTAWVRWLFDPILGELSRFLPFILTIVACAYGGGAGPGALSLALSAATGLFLFVDHPMAPSRSDRLNLAVFLVEGAGVVFLTVALRTARDAAQISASRAEAAVRQKDQFVIRVSHEWRAPLNVLAGWATQLQARPNDSAFVTRAAANMMRAIETQNRLIQDLMDYSRGSRGRLSIHPVRMLIATSIEASIEAVRADAAAKEIEVTLAIDPALRVWGDNQRLQQVFTNLLTNSIKFTPKRGRVIVSGRRFGDNVEIEVADTGVGIDPEQLKVVFEPFTQTHPARDTALGGLGLGLSITREIVLLHAGTIEASSAGPGHGSTFTIRLPVSAALTEKPVERGASSRQG